MPEAFPAEVLTLERKPSFARAIVPGTAADTQPLARAQWQLWLIVLQVPLLVLGVLFPLTHLFTHVARDYGEGWSAYWAQVAVVAPGQLYAPHAMLANNYPPLSFLLAGHLGALVGDPLIAGRLISVAALAATAGLSGLAVWRLGRSAVWAAMAVLLVLDYAVFPFNHFFAVNNPQWLAQAFILLAIMPLLGGPICARALVLSGLGVGLTLMTKHNVLAWPIAVTVWLVLGYKTAQSRRLLAVWVGLGLAIGGAAVAGLYAAYGADIFTAILGFTRKADLSGGFDGLVDTVTFAPLLIAAWLGARAAKADPRMRLLALYTAIAVALGMAQRFGAGVVDNAHFEAIIASIILACAGLGAARTGALGAVISAKRQNWLSVLMLVPLIVSWPITGGDRWHDMVHETEVERTYGAVIADVRAKPGPVLCEDLAVCFWAGKPMALDFFAYGQKLRSGTSPAALETMITTQAPAAIVLDLAHPKRPDKARLPLPLPVLMHHCYKAVRVVPGYIEELVPAEPTPAR